MHGYLTHHLYDQHGCHHYHQLASLRSHKSGSLRPKTPLISSQPWITLSGWIGLLRSNSWMGWLRSGPKPGIAGSDQAQNHGLSRPFLPEHTNGGLKEESKEEESLDDLLAMTSRIYRKKKTWLQIWAGEGMQARENERTLEAKRKELEHERSLDARPCRRGRWACRLGGGGARHAGLKEPWRQNEGATPRSVKSWLQICVGEGAGRVAKFVQMRAQGARPNLHRRKERSVVREHERRLEAKAK